MREKLINQGSSLTLDQAADIARTHELSQAQLESMSHNGTDSTVHAVVKKHKKHRYGMKPPPPTATTTTAATEAATTTETTRPSQK